VARLAGDDSVTQNAAALNLLVNHVPCLKSVLMQHVHATFPEELGLQLHVLPPSLHTAACNNHLKTLPSGRRHLKLDTFSVASFLAASAVLPQMQGLDSLQLSVDIGNVDFGSHYQSFSFLSRMTTLKVLDLSGCKSVTDRGVAHLSGLTALQHLNLSGCKNVTDRGVNCMRDLTALQHLNLSGCTILTDTGINFLWHLSALQHLDLSGCKRVTGSNGAHLSGLTALQHLDLSGCKTLIGRSIAHPSGLPDCIT
jgi:hypothetical protein